MMRTVGQNEIHLGVRSQIVIKVVLYVTIFEAEDFFKYCLMGKCLLVSVSFSGGSAEYYSRFKRQGFHDQSLILCTQQSGFEDHLLI